MESLQIRAINILYIVFTIHVNTISSIIIRVNLKKSSIFKTLSHIFAYLLSQFSQALIAQI